MLSQILNKSKNINKFSLYFIMFEGLMCRKTKRKYCTNAEKTATDPQMLKDIN